MVEGIVVQVLVFLNQNVAIVKKFVSRIAPRSISFEAQWYIAAILVGVILGHLGDFFVFRKVGIVPTGFDVAFACVESAGEGDVP